MSLVEPTALPSASAADVGKVLSQLLELHAQQQLTSLSDQCLDAISSLPSEDRPTSYEGLLDVARYCIDEEPGWKSGDKAVLLSGHPRIGQPTTSKDKQGMSESSRKEQRADTTDVASDQRLALLNFCYEHRYPQLRYVTFVAGRPRAAIAEELASFLGPKLASLSPPASLSSSSYYDELLVSPSDEVQDWASKNIDAIGTDSTEWTQELNRGLDALFEIAASRASKLPSKPAAATAESSSSSITAPTTQKATGGNTIIEEKDAESFDEPFLSLKRFTSLVEASPILTQFFQHDLANSFHLTAPAPPAESARDAIATLAAVAVTGGGGGGATRKRVKGLLGGLWGEVADRAGKVTGRESRRGPLPAFGGREGNITNLEAGVVGADVKEAKGVSKIPASASGQSMTTTTSTTLDGAEERLRVATKRLVEADRSHFVIDEPGNASAGALGEEGEEEEEEEEGGVEDLGMDRLGIEDGAQAREKDATLSAKDQQLAKDLRSAPPQ